MHIQLLQWGLFSFMLGLLLSLPLAAVHYQKSPQWTKIFTNPRKLKSAHLDFFTQAFAAAFVYLLEYSLQMNLPEYVVVLILFGTVCNPLLLLAEATPLNRSGIGAYLYKVLRATSPISLLVSWSFIAWSILPFSLLLLLAGIVLVGLVLILQYKQLASSE